MVPGVPRSSNSIPAGSDALNTSRENRAGLTQQLLPVQRSNNLDSMVQAQILEELRRREVIQVQPPSSSYGESRIPPQAPENPLAQELMYDVPEISSIPAGNDSLNTSWENTAGPTQPGFTRMPGSSNNDARTTFPIEDEDAGQAVDWEQYFNGDPIRQSLTLDDQDPRCQVMPSSCNEEVRIADPTNAPTETSQENPVDQGQGQASVSRGMEVQVTIGNRWSLEWECGTILSAKNILHISVISFVTRIQVLCYYFQDKQLTAHQILDVATNMLAAFHAATTNDLSSDSCSRACSFTEIWRPPTTGFFKLNTGAGMFSNGHAGFKKIGACLDPETTEAKAAIFGLEAADSTTVQSPHESWAKQCQSPH
ncbi:hypothetical protein Tsubulata_043526, partial [Turnera subulata]